MRTIRALLRIVGALVLLANPAAARAAKWTVATILVGEYDDMEKRMRTTGSSDDVNVVVLHYKGANDAVAYKLLKDTDTSHPPGQCCPGDEPTCCGIENIPLATIGIDSTVSASAVKKFYQYLVQQFPADHYLLGLRGAPDPTHALVGHSWTDGITIAELNSALKALVDARGGKKVEVLVAGYCVTGAIDVAYGVSQNVNYYVGSPNFTNPPVATRWRVYRWAREVIEKPNISIRNLASKVVDHFELTTTDCVENNDGCSNAPKEPWTCLAIESAKLPAVAAAVKDAVCAVLPSLTPSMHSSALAETTLYGSTKTPRYDMKHYFMNLKAKVSDAAAKAAIDRVIAAHGASIVSWKYEAGSYNDKAYGYSLYMMEDLGNVNEIGNWQIDSLWQAYMAKVNGSSTNPLPAATGMVIDPAEVNLSVGGQSSAIARGVSSKYPSMCALPSVSWSTDALNGVAKLDSASANPVVVTGQQPGTGTLKASASGFTGEAAVKVSGTARPDAGADSQDEPDGGSTITDAGADHPGDTDGGSTNKAKSSSSGSCGSNAGFVLFLPPLLGAGLKRRHRA
jgi:hypothetical protein